MNESFLQFTKDLHRLTLYLDNIQSKDFNHVYEYLSSKLSVRETEICIYFLTQSSLADFLINEQNTLDNELTHITCDNKYIVYIDTCLKTIRISKSFKCLYITECMDDFLVDFSELNITCDINENTILHYWNYDFKK